MLLAAGYEIMYYYIVHYRSNALIARDRDSRSPAIDALLPVAPAQPAQKRDMHLYQRMHLLSMKNLVVHEEKSVQNHHSDDA